MPHPRTGSDRRARVHPRRRRRRPATGDPLALRSFGLRTSGSWGTSRFRNFRNRRNRIGPPIVQEDEEGGGGKGSTVHSGAPVAGTTAATGLAGGGARRASWPQGAPCRGAEPVRAAEPPDHGACLQVPRTRRSASGACRRAPIGVLIIIGNHLAAYCRCPTPSDPGSSPRPPQLPASPTYPKLAKEASHAPHQTPRGHRSTAVPGLSPAFDHRPWASTGFWTRDLTGDPTLGGSARVLLRTVPIPSAVMDVIELDQPRLVRWASRGGVPDEWRDTHPRLRAGNARETRPRCSSPMPAGPNRRRSCTTAAPSGADFLLGAQEVARAVARVWRIRTT